MREEIEELEVLMERVIEYCKEKDIKVVFGGTFKKGNDRLNIDWRL